MDITDFNSNYVNNLLEKVSKEHKSAFLFGDFNINLFNYKVHNPTIDVLDSLFYLTFCSQLESLATQKH